MCYNRKKAFTIIEVLLVISIIALMIAIITPSLRKARQSARSVYCRSLLKQYSTTHYSYFLNTNELLPISTQGSSGGTQPWFTLDEFRSYIGLQPLCEEYKIQDNRNIQRYKPSYPERFICPSAMYALDNPEDSLYPIDRSYGLNAHIYPSETVTTIHNPSQRICTADAMDWWFDYWECNKYETYGETWLGFNTSGEAAFRHSEKANTVYWDGHCASITAKQLRKTLLTSEKTGTGRRDRRR